MYIDGAIKRANTLNLKQQEKALNNTKLDLQACMLKSFR